jgi:hypothetical protein
LFFIICEDDDIALLFRGPHNLFLNARKISPGDGERLNFFPFRCGSNAVVGRRCFNASNNMRFESHAFDVISFLFGQSMRPTSLTERI